MAQQQPTEPAAQPEDRSPAQVAADLAWLRQVRADTRHLDRVYGGHEQHLDTLDVGR